MLITSTKSYNNDTFKCLVYGDSGVGKTTLASTLNTKTLLINAEAGVLSLSDYDIDKIDLNVGDDGSMLDAIGKYERLREVSSYLCTDEARERYKSIFIDSLTEIGQIVFEWLKHSDPKFQDAKNNLQLWGQYGEKMRLLIKFFRDLPWYNVVFTALSKTEKDELQRRIKVVDISGSISERIHGYFDEVFYYEVFNNEEGEKQRRLVTQPCDRFTAKDRSSKLDEYEKPNLGEIAKKIKGE